MAFGWVRRSEIESDVWESLHDPDVERPQLVLRVAGGAFDDVRWRAPRLGEESKTVWLALPAGSLVMVAMWESLRRTPVRRLIAESAWMYPLTGSIHLASVAVFLCAIVVFDLRLLGLTLRHVRVSQTLSYGLPWVTTAAVVVVVSGTVLLLADPARLLANVFFRIKGLALVLALLNVSVFHLVPYSRTEEWDGAATSPMAAGTAAVISLLLWTVVVLSSRLLVFN
jgi:hypothetical protein